MKSFRCQACGNLLHFDNRRCLRCGSTLGFDPQVLSLEALAPGAAPGTFQASGRPDRVFRFCTNARFDVCNWLVPAGAGDAACRACRHNHLLPDIASPKGLERWRAICRAQRHLIYSLERLHLPHPDRRERPDDGLEFDWLEDAIAHNGQRIPARISHDAGRISVRVAEADDLARETARHDLQEPYRTLIGHLRHECGHYYWDRLVRGGDWLWRFRTLFGDERASYDQALARYYKNGPVAGWESQYISAYAAAHPWEDFAETFAHCLLIIDALDTASAYGLALTPDPYGDCDFQSLAEVWVRLSVALNSMHESFGERPLYPFVLSGGVIAKLSFVHRLILAVAR